MSVGERSIGQGGKEVTANDIGSFSKGFNRGKFSQLRYLLGNTARV